MHALARVLEPCACRCAARHVHVCVQVRGVATSLGAAAVVSHSRHSRSSGTHAQLPASAVAAAAAAAAGTAAAAATVVAAMLATVAVAAAAAAAASAASAARRGGELASGMAVTCSKGRLGGCRTVRDLAITLYISYIYPTTYSTLPS